MRALLAFIALALAIYCVVECLQAAPQQVRTFSRPIWILLIVLLPIAGSLGWLLAGRPTVPPPARPTRRTGPLAPDDDPDFLRSLRRDPPVVPEQDSDQGREDDGDRPR